MLKIAVLASGRGTNLQAIIDATGSGGPLAELARVVLVVSDRPKAMALERARAHGIPTAVVSKKDFPDRAEHDRQVMALLAGAGTQLLCLAGYLRLLSPEFIEAYAGRMINVHPALLPAFPGLEVQRAALDYGVKVSGCTVHFVTLEMDSGPIIVQRPVPILEDDTPETLAARILEQEHPAFVEAIALYAAGRLRVEGRRVRILAE